MFNMLKPFIFSALIVLHVGCAPKSSIEVQGSKKVYDKEDLYILSGLHAEKIKDYATASDKFYILYEKTHKKEYLYRSLRNDLEANNSSRVVKRVDAISSKEINDFELIRMKIIALIKQSKLLEAKELALELVKKSKEIDDYLLVSEIYVKDKKFNTAIKYLESAYNKDYNEKILDKMSIVLYVNLNRKKDAIAQLETHTRIHGCSKLICARLIGYYSNDNNIEGLLSTYLRVYKIDSNKDIAQKIVQIYSYKKDYVNMIKFLQESKTDDELLLQLYIQFKNYKKASFLAYDIYNDGGDITYLGQSAIFEYEGSEDKGSKAMHKSVIKKLHEVIKIRRDGLYLNYLGYLLIDHKIDVKQGMKYVQEALVLEPNSAYYLDSLAWGHYMLGECKKAKKIMNRVANMDGSSNKEVVKHIKMIDKCKNSKKGKVKK